jgi:hypothetical protein
MSGNEIFAGFVIAVFTAWICLLALHTLRGE